MQRFCRGHAVRPMTRYMRPQSVASKIESRIRQHEDPEADWAENTGGLVYLSDVVSDSTKSSRLGQRSPEFEPTCPKIRYSFPRPSPGKRVGRGAHPTRPSESSRRTRPSGDEKIERRLANLLPFGS